MKRATRILATTAIAALVMTVDSCINPVVSTASKPTSPASEQTDDYAAPRSTVVTATPLRAAMPDPVSTPKLPLHLTVARGDTYGRWATTHCGTFNAWTSIQAANGWPERRIPVGATATINCPATPAKAVTPPAAPVATGAWVHPFAAWVHPFASGIRANSSGLCWGAARTGHTHKGVDLLQPSGTPIRAVSAGTIKTRASSATAGNYVTIAHAGNTFSRYMHLRAPSPLTVGAHVQAGQVIGYVGATGNAKGPHLHFEILQGGYTTAHAINPAVFMRGKGINLGC